MNFENICYILYSSNFHFSALDLKRVINKKKIFYLFYSESLKYMYLHHKITNLIYTYPRAKKMSIIKENSTTSEIIFKSFSRDTNHFEFSYFCMYKGNLGPHPAAPAAGMSKA